MTVSTLNHNPDISMALPDPTEPVLHPSAPLLSEEEKNDEEVDDEDVHHHDVSKATLELPRRPRQWASWWDKMTRCCRPNASAKWMPRTFSPQRGDLSGTSNKKLSMILEETPSAIFQEEGSRKNLLPHSSQRSSTGARSLEGTAPEGVAAVSAANATTNTTTTTTTMASSSSSKPVGGGALLQDWWRFLLTVLFLSWAGQHPSNNKSRKLLTSSTTTASAASSAEEESSSSS